MIGQNFFELEAAEAAGAAGGGGAVRGGGAGVGFGRGVKGVRAVCVFRWAERLKTVVEEGWDLGIDANAAAEVGGEGLA